MFQSMVLEAVSGLIAQVRFYYGHKTIGHCHSLLRQYFEAGFVAGVAASVILDLEIKSALNEL